ncbi:PAS domain-containing protein [Methanohalophilus sp. RSK]|uniref:PAS domain-containing sensor histidine kinase n=1 Tax=Methanohalophilus sp. RSK TaxID=2485783 RepID=UPI000F43A0E4|nr:ATP-binding protein [Methanohalophilus sp. RSK]RNI13846.1 PAS domain-containing protein [Methanohalophilus sp. RSK]
MNRKTNHENEKERNVLYEIMDEGICFHEIVYDYEGNPIDYKITDANPAYENILGLKREKVKDVLASELYGSDEPPYLDIYSKVAETGKPAKFETYFEPMDKHFQISVYSYQKGKFITVFNDITEQKNTEASLSEALTQRNKNLQRIIHLTDTLRCIRDVNQAIVKEKNSYESLQKMCDSLTRYNNYTAAWIGIFDENNKINIITESGHSNKIDNFRQYIQKNNLPHCAQCALEASDYIIIENPEKECSGCPLQNECGREDVFVSKIEYGNKVYGTIAIVIPEDYVSDEEIIGLSREVVGDISFSLYNLELEALRQTAEESLLEGKLVAEEANRTKSEFLANMSHELRTPLNSIIGFSQVLSGEQFGELNEKQHKYISNVENSGEHLLELINDILDISKVESGNMDYVPESVNIEEIIDDTITLVSPMAKKKAIDLHVSFKHENPDIQVDRSKFRDIMYNLLSNAIKFTPEKGEVQVTTKITDGKLHVSVSDTGIGIPEGEFKSIFDPFKQVDSSANRKFGGTGLGLSLVKKYVEMHNGNIWVESEVGKGSTFTFTVPLV